VIDADNPTAWTTFAEQQLTRGWLEWIGRNPQRLDEFYAEVPDLPSDRYSTAALRTAEHCLLTRFSGPGAVPDPRVVDRWGCFLGEVLVHSLHGQWFNAPAVGQAMRPAILFPYTAARVYVADWVHRALRTRTGGMWTGLHAGLADLCGDWWQSDRRATDYQSVHSHSDYRRGRR
jgi:hypothetical protein